MRRLKDLLRLSGNATEDVQPPLENTMLPDHQRDRLERDIHILEDEYGEKEKRLYKEAEKQAQEAAEDSLKQLHIIQMGVCPHCGEHLNQHLFAAICEACGWNAFEMPQKGPVRVHLKAKPASIDGDRCYSLSTGDVLVVKRDVVVAKVLKDAIEWIEYTWTEEEIEKQYKQVIDRLKITCSWCEAPADPEKDGFHLVQLAFGSSQERFVFCSSQCFEAFRAMYPSRVHRNCYERKCSDCNLCVKRYDDETDGIRMIAKDFLKSKNMPHHQSGGKQE